MHKNKPASEPNGFLDYKEDPRSANTLDYFNIEKNFIGYF